MYFDTPRDFIGGVYDELALRRPAARLGHHRPQGDRPRRDARDVLRLPRPLVQAVADGRRRRRQDRRRPDRARSSELLGDLEPGATGDVAAGRAAARERLAGQRVYTKESDQAHICVGVASYPLEHPDRYALQLLATVLGGGMSSRLFTEVRERRGLAYYVFGVNHSYTDAGSLYSQAGVDINRIDDAVTTIVGRAASRSPRAGSRRRAREGAQLREGPLRALAREPAGPDHVRAAPRGARGRARSSRRRCSTRLDEVTGEDVQRVARDLIEGHGVKLAADRPVRRRRRGSRSSCPSRAGDEAQHARPRRRSERRRLPPACRRAPRRSPAQPATLTERRRCSASVKSRARRVGYTIADDVGASVGAAAGDNAARPRRRVPDLVVAGAEREHRPGRSSRRVSARTGSPCRPSVQAKPAPVGERRVDLIARHVRDHAVHEVGERRADQEAPSPPREPPNTDHAASGRRPAARRASAAPSAKYSSGMSFSVCGRPGSLKYASESVGIAVRGEEGRRVRLGIRPPSRRSAGRAGAGAAPTGGAKYVPDEALRRKRRRRSERRRQQCRGARAQLPAATRPPRSTSMSTSVEPERRRDTSAAELVGSRTASTRTAA